MDYNFTHDRYHDRQTRDAYYDGLAKYDYEDYVENPLEFFRSQGVPRGRHVEETQRRHESSKKYLLKQQTVRSTCG